MTELPAADIRLARLLTRLLTAAEASFAAGDVETARATAEEVRAVDPTNERASALLQRLEEPHQAPVGQRALMTLLFSDLVGSTLMSEQVEPEQLRDLFALYRATSREAVERYGGVVMQYMGDGILAEFGFPEAHEDDARRAVLAGLDLVEAMASMYADLARRLGVAPRVRVGLHTGRVLVTDITRDRLGMERDSIVGVAPNLAARIQGAAAPDQVVISDVTQHLVESDFFVRSLGERELKGISRPIEVFEVERPRHAGARFHAERYRRVSLVGRDEQRAALVTAWKGVQAGTESTLGSTFLVVGEPGIGKTRLVADVVNNVESSGGLVLGAGCLPYYSNVALWPITQMVNGILATMGDTADRLQLLVDHLTSLGMDPARSLPYLGPLIGVSGDERYPAPELDPSAALDETLTQFVEWIAALGGKTPRLFVVEDLHWADPSTLALLGKLARRRPRGVLTVATTRSSSAIGWKDDARLLRLSRLGEAASRGLVDSLTGTGPLSAKIETSIVERAEGVPLFIEELTRSCLVESLDDPLPLRLQELFTWRLKSPLVDLRVAQAAATIGPAFDAEVVSAVIGDPATVAGQLVVMANAGIIEPVDPSAGIYRFRHALMRDAAYETQVLEDRAQTHAHVAAVLLERGAEPALVAEHLDRAGDAGGAVQQYLVGAQAQQSRGAHTEAAGLLTRALALLETLPESQERDLTELTDRMLRALSVSSMQGYAAPDVQSDHRRAEVLAKRLGSRPEVLPSLIAIWSYWFASGELGTARGLIDRLIGMVSQASFSWFAPEVESCAGWQSFYEGRLEEARAHLQLAMDGFLQRPAEQSVSPFWPLPNDPIAVTAVALACVSLLQGDSEQVPRWERQALARTEAIGFPRGPWSAAFVKSYSAWIRRCQGQEAEARALGAQVVAIGAEHGYAYWSLIGSIHQSGTSPDRPDRVFLEQVVQTLRAMGQEAFAPSNLAALARLSEREGDLDGALGLVNQALAVVYKTGEHVHLPELLRQRAEYVLARGGPASEAVADLEEAILQAREQGARVAGLRAAVALARLPEDLRPGDWRHILSTARSVVPAVLVSDDTAAADDLLR
jgi:class 3 adenylate cyclase/tetratricopeptide (TPR) repeat protein